MTRDIIIKVHYVIDDDLLKSEAIAITPPSDVKKYLKPELEEILDAEGYRGMEIIVEDTGEIKGDAGMTIEEVKSLQDGTRVVLTQLGTEWGEDKDSSGVCVKIGNRLVEADINRPDDSSIWYPYYTIDEMNDKGYEFSVVRESGDEEQV